MVLDVAQTANLVVRLAVEMAALLALGAWGWHRGRRPWSRVGLTAGIPAAAATTWALFAAPGATLSVPGVAQLAVQVLVLGSAAAALVAAGRRRMAAAFVAVAVGNALLMAAWGQ